MREVHPHDHGRACGVSADNVPPLRAGSDHRQKPFGQGYGADEQCAGGEEESG